MTLKGDDMSVWHSLYVFTSQALEQTLANWLIHQGYTRFDPFNTFGGTAYPQALRLFLAPTRDDTCRILVDCNQAAPVTALALALSQCGPCLSIQLDGTTPQIVLYHEGHESDDWMLVARRGVTPEQIEVARRPGTIPQSDSLIPLEDLPSGLRAMAQTVSQYHVGRLFQKMANQVMNQSQQTAAQRFLQGLPRWDSAGGQMLISTMSLTRVPKTWRDPDFATLRTAYWLHLRQRTQPNAPLLPGDDASLRRVPDALTYTPLYGGKA
jgi:hypothetical protein